MADTLQSVPANCASTGSLVACAHVYGISGVSKVEATGELALLQRANLVAWWYRKTQPRRRHSFWDGFKSDCRVSKGEGEERRHGTAERVAGHPDLGIGI